MPLQRKHLKAAASYAFMPGIKNPNQKEVLRDYGLITGTITVSSLFGNPMFGAAFAGMFAMVRFCHFAMDYGIRCIQASGGQKVTGFSPPAVS